MSPVESRRQGVIGTRSQSDARPRTRGAVQPEFRGAREDRARETAYVTDRGLEFLAACCERTDGRYRGRSLRLGAGLWVGRREVAHFDDDRTLDLRLTRAEIRRRQAELTSDARIVLRRLGPTGSS